MTAPADPAALLSQFGNADPRLQMLLQFMQQRQAGLPAEAVVAQSDVDRALARNEELRTACRALRARNDYLAAALGACPRCWGEDEECRLCDGRGAPGAFQPRRDAFDACVLPAIRRLEPEPVSDARRQTSSAGRSA